MLSGVHNRKYCWPLLLWTILSWSCKSSVLPPPTDAELTTAWADMATYLTQNTPSNSPTFASRAFGYIGLTMYESIVQGYPDHQSVASQLNGLGSLSMPEKEFVYNWQLALNAGQAEILRSIYIQTSAANKKRIDSLEASIVHRWRKHVKNEEQFLRSIVCTVVQSLSTSSALGQKPMFPRCGFSDGGPGAFTL